MLQILSAFVSGLLLADFMSGVIHWIEDRYGRPDWPVLGGVIAANIAHHRAPPAFLSSKVMKRNGSTIAVTLIIYILLTVIFGFHAFLTAAAFFGCIANEVHAFAHRKKRPVFVRVMQSVGIMQSPRHHGRHHARPQNSHYCIITNWLNPLLEAIRFWSALERIIPATPRRDF